MPKTFSALLAAARLHAQQQTPEQKRAALEAAEAKRARKGAAFKRHMQFVAPVAPAAETKG